MCISITTGPNTHYDAFPMPIPNKGIILKNSEKKQNKQTQNMKVLTVLNRWAEEKIKTFYFLIIQLLMQQNNFKVPKTFKDLKQYYTMNSPVLGQMNHGNLYKL